MAFYDKRKKKSGSSIRLTGMFKSKKRGLAVGSITDLDELIALVKKARAEEQGLVFFLWRNDIEDDEKKQPDYTLYADVNKDEDRPRTRRDRDEDERPVNKKKIIEDSDEEDVPF